MSNPTAPPNSSSPTTAQITGGVYNFNIPVLLDGQGSALQLDSSGNLKVNVIAGGGSSNVNIANVKGNPPALGNPLPVELSDGTNALGVSGNPFFDNIAQWGGTAVSAPPASGVPAVGTEVAPVVKPVQRKNNAVVTTAAIAANSSYVSSWIDTQQTGDSFVSLVWNITSPTGLASNNLKVQGSDDQVNVVNVAQFSPTSANVGTASTKIPNRYWRIVESIGTGGASPVYISATASNIPQGIFPNVSTPQGNISGDGTLVLMSSNTPGDSSNCSFAINANFGAAVALGTAQFVVTGNPLSGANWAAVRTPTTFKTVQATATGNTPLWTPTAGKKFRLMRFIIDLTSNANLAAGAVVTISFQDATTALNIAFDVFIPTTAVTTGFGGYTSGWIDLGNGLLSAAANNVLNVNLSAAITTGNVRVTCCGTEE